MELRQLEYFVAVAQELHFARAASRLHVAQPSVSQQIKALERQLGVRLFERTSKAVALTSGGAELLPLAEQLLTDSRRLQQTAQQSARRASGSLRIGFLADELSQPRVDQLLTAVRRLHSRLRLEFQQVDFAEHHNALESRQVDVSFVVEPAPSSIVSVRVFRWPRVVAVSTTLADVRGSDIRSWLAQEPIALPNQMASQAWRRGWTPPTDEAGEVYIVGQDSMEAMLAVVGAGRAVCVLPEYVKRFYPQPGVTFVALPDLEPCVVGIGALRGRLTEPHIAAIVGVAQTLNAHATKRTKRETNQSTSAEVPYATEIEPR
jgi:DNA-binding transcriptional LysR family regulator